MARLRWLQFLGFNVSSRGRLSAGACRNSAARPECRITRYSVLNVGARPGQARSKQYSAPSKRPASSSLMRMTADPARGSWRTARRGDAGEQRRVRQSHDRRQANARRHNHGATPAPISSPSTNTTAAIETSWRPVRRCARLLTRFFGLRATLRRAPSLLASQEGIDCRLAGGQGLGFRFVVPAPKILTVSGSPR